MKTLLLLLLPFTSYAQIERDSVRLLKKHNPVEDTSFVYQLPYLPTKKFLMVQGYFTHFSHKHLIANDFKMKKGSKICAARGGVVIDAYDQSTIGGIKNKTNNWNYILIMHSDSSVAIYGHLLTNGIQVKVNDTVATGQVIALSGHTGYSAFPHLHFAVYDKNEEQIPVRFATHKGEAYLRSMKKY